MRKPILAANWKMYKTIEESVAFVRSFKRSVANVKGREILICPPATALAAVAKAVKSSNILVGGQNMSDKDEGAYTGELSADMLKEAGATHVIVGHSERRQYFKETNESCNAKILQAFAKKLVPVYCVGETWGQRRAGKTNAVIEKQIKEGLAGIGPATGKKLIVAYEPVWAIGTGKTATPEIAQEVHALIRKLLARKFDKKTADAIRIQYGGSVKPGNVDTLMAQPDIDGALVGGASLQPDSFSRIVKYNK